MLIIIMIIHLFPGAFQDMQGRLAKQSGKRDTSYVHGIIDLEGVRITHNETYIIGRCEY